jgi:hypothetical protein
MNFVPEKRIATKVSRAAKERKLKEKAHNAQIKRLRSKPGADD